MDGCRFLVSALEIGLEIIAVELSGGQFLPSVQTMAATMRSSYVEAAANGLPLLCRRDPCLDGVLVEGKNGYEYEAEQEFCELLDTILSSPDWCQTARL